MNKVAFLQSGSGTVTFLINNKPYAVGVDHPNYYRIIKVMNNRDADELLALIDVPTAVQEYTKDRIQIKEGLFLYDGLELHNTLTERIMKLMLAGHDFDYMLAFLNNLMANPSSRAVEELYTFLENRSLPITEDGCFLAYKSVRANWKDWYSGTMDNSVGQTVSIPRNRVDDNCDRGCSHGLHAGAIKYVSDYHGHDDNSHVVIVKINPTDVVSVPLDCDCTKVRVCSYEVVDVYDGELEKVLYSADVGNIQEIIGMFDQQVADHWYNNDSEDDDIYDDFDGE